MRKYDTIIDILSRQRDHDRVARAPEVCAATKRPPLPFLCLSRPRPQKRPAPAEPQPRRPRAGGLRRNQKTTPSTSLPCRPQPAETPCASGTTTASPARRWQRRNQKTVPSPSLPMPPATCGNAMRQPNRNHVARAPLATPQPKDHTFPFLAFTARNLRKRHAPAEPQPEPCFTLASSVRGPCAVFPD